MKTQTVNCVSTRAVTIHTSPRAFFALRIPGESTLDAALRVLKQSETPLTAVQILRLTARSADHITVVLNQELKAAKPRVVKSGPPRARLWAINPEAR